MKTATQTTADCEAALGPRGHLQVTKTNRGDVRKWLSAQGFPAMFSGGLSYTELRLAYNDTTGRELGKLRQKLESAVRETGEEETSTAQRSLADTAAQRSLLDTVANTGGASTKGATVGGTTETTNAEKERQANKATDENLARAGVTATTDDVEAAARQLAEAISRREGKAAPINGEEVRAIVKEELKDLDAKLAEITTTRIEVRFPDTDTVNVLEGVHHPEFETFLQAAASRQVDGFRPNIMLSGPAGSGKTFAAKNVIKALNLEFEYNGALSMAHEVLGYQDANGTYHETSFFRGYTRKSGYVFDEVDGSDNSPLLALNAALANGTASFPHGMFARHPDSLIIATANTWGLGATADYVGRSKLDAAFLSRFPIRIHWDYDEKLEQQICGNVEWAKRVQKARRAAKKAGIKVIICPRISIGGAALINAGMDADKAAKLTYLANLTPEQRQIIEAH
jgi:cobaltochelatase CobS